MAQEIKRIEREFIFQKLIEAETRIEIHHDAQRTSARIVSMNPSSLAVKAEQLPFWPEGSVLKVFFRFRSHAMTFTTKVLKTSDGVVNVDQPRIIYRDLSRNFERIVAPSGISVQLVTEGSEMTLSYPDIAVKLEHAEPQAEPGFESVKIADLLRSFRARASSFSSENTIVMFRERVPESLPERLMAASGRLVMMPFSDLAESHLDSVSRSRILTREDGIELQIEAGREVFEVLEEFAKYDDERRGHGVRSELFCPILYRQYIVGYLYLMRSDPKGPIFEAHTVDFLFQFSRILAYALKVNGYFKGEPVKERIDAEVIDISGSGLLVSLPDEEQGFELFTDVHVSIQLEERVVPTVARVVRSYHNRGRRYLGFRFTQIESDDMERLFQRLYGREYRGDIDFLGGSDPELYRDETNRAGL